MWAANGDIGAKIILTPSRPRQDTVQDGVDSILMAAGHGHSVVATSAADLSALGVSTVREHARARSRPGSFSAGHPPLPPTITRGSFSSGSAGSSSSQASPRNSSSSGSADSGSKASAASGHEGQSPKATAAASAGADKNTTVNSAATTGKPPAHPSAPSVSSSVSSVPSSAPSGPGASANSATPTTSPTASEAHNDLASIAAAGLKGEEEITASADAYAEQEERSERARRAGDAATQAKLSRVLSKQTTGAVLTTLRAIAHRAAAEMERWRVSVGRSQEDELLAYWAAWAAHMTGVKRTNERLLAYARQSAAAAEGYALQMAAAAAVLGPIATGEVMTVLPHELQSQLEGHSSGGSSIYGALGGPSSSSASATGGSAGIAHAAERSMASKTSAGVAAATREAQAAVIASSSGAGVRRLASVASSSSASSAQPSSAASSSAAGGRPSAGSDAGAASAAFLHGGPLSVSTAASAMIELHAQVRDLPPTVIKW